MHCLLRENQSPYLFHGRTEMSPEHLESQVLFVNLEMLGTNSVSVVWDTPNTILFGRELVSLFVQLPIQKNCINF